MWLRLHHLSNAFAAAGFTREERLDQALARFEALPPPVRRELHKELHDVSIDLLTLLPLVSSYQEADGRSSEAPDDPL